MICDECGEIFIIRNKEYKHTNIGQNPPIHYFCGKHCKGLWVWKMIHNRESREAV